MNVKDTLGRTPRMLAELRRESEVLVLLFAYTSQETLRCSDAAMGDRPTQNNRRKQGLL